MSASQNSKGLNIFKSEDRVNKIRSALDKRQPDFSLVLENINDPHNLSAVLRSCDAVGILEVCLLYHSGQKIPRISATSSATASKWMYIRKFDNIQSCYDYLHSSGKKILTTQLSKDAKSLYEIDFTEPVALVFGNEHSGVSEEAWKQSDGNFIIPQVGMTQSLNISVAAAVSVFEAFRQKSAAGHYSESRLSAEAYKQVFEDWQLIKYRQ
jgi:tRNA (guanosine-2'-O-)-methyltransferase